MKRLFFRIGALALIVLLGLIAYAYAQRGVTDRYSSDNTATDSASPLRSPGAQNTSPNYTVNPLRDKPFRAGPAEGNSSDKKSIKDPRLKRVAAETPAADSADRPATDPFGLTSHKNGSPGNQAVSQTVPGNDIPDATALDPPQTDRGADQSRYPQLLGPNLHTPSNVGPMLSNGREPAPFKADPMSAPMALSQTADKRQDRNTGPFAGNSQPEGFAQSEGTGQPGAKQLEGAQSPQVTIQKFAPKEIQVGKPAVFKITVRNTGTIPAGQVEIRDQTPRGTKLLGTTPRAAQDARGEIVWTVGTLRPGEESSVEMEVMPTAEGEIGSVATVHFGADASARTISTRPKLALEISAPEKVMIGEQVMLSIVVSNPGTGMATGVVLEERLPAVLQHPAGEELEYEVGDIRPGESKKIDLPMAAVASGQAVNILTARADGNLQTQQRLELQVVAPKLDIALEGSKRRYLEREAVYQISVSNPGTAAAEQVELVAYLPQGLKFLSANNSGYYDQASRAVHWRLQELPCNETGSVELVTMPVEAGQQSIKLRGTAQKGLAVEKEQPVLVEGIASIVFQPVDVTGPIEVGGEAAYEVRVVNQGSKAANNVRLAVLLPNEMQPLAAEGPTRHAIESGRIVFEGLARLDPKADAVFRVKAKGIRPGDLRTKFQLLTDEMQTPVTKEESTRVFADE